MLKRLPGMGLAGEGRMKRKRHLLYCIGCYYPSMAAGKGKDIADLKRSELASNGEFFELWEATLTSVQIYSLSLLSAFGVFFHIL